MIFLSVLAHAADPLPRGAALGVRLEPADGQGARVVEVFPDLTGQMIGIRAGDVITELGGQAVAGPGDVVAWVAAVDAGDPVALVVSREGKPKTLKGKARPRPNERYEGAVVDYGAVAFQQGQLRDLLVLPEGVEQPPVVFLLQGFACASIEPPNPQHPYRRLTAELVARGVGVYRVEKPGLGDSEGGPRCEDIDFDTEVSAFRAAYDALVGQRGIDADRVFLFGHSLGGMVAPLLAAERPPRGVVAYGTVLQSWHDYHLELLRTQGFMAAGEDPVEAAEWSEQAREPMRRFYVEDTPPAVLVAEHPEWRGVLEGAFGWDGRDHLMGRHYSFWHDLDAVPVLQAWRDTRSHVLAMYGMADFAALHAHGHELIADIADHYRPGTGTYVELPRTGHGMTVEGTREEVRDAARAGQPLPEGPFDVAVAEHLARWITEGMASDPVRLATAR